MINQDDNTEYISNIQGNNFNQAYTYSTEGFNGKFAINLATSYKDRIYLGANLNIHVINFERFTFLSESNSNTASTVTNVDFENYTLTNGAGFSFQLGAIAKLTEALRAGISYQSPTWYRFSEETTQFIQTRVDGEGTVTIDPNVLVIFPDYRLQTPGKVTGSLAYILGKKGLLSFDYTLKDYSNIEFRPTSDSDLAFINTQIGDVLDTSASYRIGGEYRVKNWSFRGGYRFEESPYQDGTFVGDLTGYSGGLGYNFGNFNIDLAYSYAQRDVNFQLFNAGTNANQVDTATQIDNELSDFVVTLGFNF